jgi:hypothetical protein
VKERRHGLVLVGKGLIDGSSAEVDFSYDTLCGLYGSNTLLGLMTKLVIDRSRFSRWHYIRDPTHIAFYSRDTMVYIATMLEAAIELIDNDVVLLCKR